MSGKVGMCLSEGKPVVLKSWSNLNMNKVFPRINPCSRNAVSIFPPLRSFQYIPFQVECGECQGQSAGIYRARNVKYLPGWQSWTKSFQ